MAGRAVSDGFGRYDLGWKMDSVGRMDEVGIFQKKKGIDRCCTYRLHEARSIATSENSLRIPGRPADSAGSL